MWEPDGPPASLKNIIVPTQFEVMSSGVPSSPTHMTSGFFFFFFCIEDEAIGKDYLLSPQALDYVPWAVAKPNRTQDQHLEKVAAIVFTWNVSKDSHLRRSISREWQYF